MSDVVTSSVTIRSRWPYARAVVQEAAQRALAQTGRRIAERTQDNMVPGYFLDTGLSKDETKWEQLTPTSGQVRIPTDYAADVELGTVHMSPRPVLTPAIQATWPGSLYGYWSVAMRGLRASGSQVLPPIDPPGPPGPPLSREDGLAYQGRLP